MGKRIWSGNQITVAFFSGLHCKAAVYILHTMPENDTILVQELMGSFTRQLALYKQLGRAVGSLMSRLVLSRGDVSGLAPELRRKGRLLESLEAERKSSAPHITAWNERKHALPEESVKELHALLDQTESAIGIFLDQEKRLRGYLERIMRKGPDSSGGNSSP